MKINQRIMGKLSALVAFIPAVGSSQQFNATVQNVTFALVNTISAPSLVAKDENGIVVKDAAGKSYLIHENKYTQESVSYSVSTHEYGSKMMSYKISNREILEELKKMGEIEGIAGYSIVLDYWRDSFVLRKKGLDDKDIGSFIQISLPALAYAAAGTGKKVTTIAYTNDGNSTKTVSESRKGRGKDVYEMKLGEKVSLSGVFVWSGAYKIFKNKETSEKYSEWIPSASKTVGINGVGPRYDDEKSGVIEGAISLSAGVLTTLNFSSTTN